jgi:outer membrane protein assembly factor BamB
MLLLYIISNRLFSCLSLFIIIKNKPEVPSCLCFIEEMLMNRSIFCCCIAAMVLTSTSMAEDNWYQYRGPQGNGHASAKETPTTWSETEHVTWKIPVRGKAWSSPVVWDNQIWLTTAPPDGKELSAICVDFATGKVLHDIKVFDIPNPQFCIERNSYASPTPVVEKGKVFVHYGSHGTACLDTATGSMLWSRQDLECDHHRGAASSPVVWENLLILTFDGFDKQYIVALDKATGKNVWLTDRNFNYGTDNGDAKKAYSTPHITIVDNKPQLISPSAGETAGYDPATGKELWKLKSGGMNAACRPVVGNGLAILGTADGGFQCYALKLGGSGDLSQQIAWKISKGAPRYSSPIMIDDLVYMGTEKGIVTCVEAATGNVVWQERLAGLFMPSPIYTAGKLYMFTEEGTAYVLAPGKEFKLLATNKVNDGIMASPAVVGKSLILRTKTALYRID